MKAKFKSNNKNITNKMKYSIIGAIGLVSVLLYFIISYFIMPVLSINYLSTLILIFIATLIIAATLRILGIRQAIWIPIVAALLIGIKIVMSSPIINHSKFRNILGEVKTKEFSTEISPIDLSKIPIVDEELAKNLGEKKLGEQVALGSQVSLSDFTLINVDNNLYWVSPLVHSGFFKWNANKQGTPGYIKINATNPQDIKLVQEINSGKVRIRYQPEAYFSDNLHRRIYKSGYKSVGLTDYSFELDDSGKPYWVVTKYKNTIGVSGSDAIGVIVVDAQTGEVFDYDMDKVPSWVDRVIPVDFALQQLDDWGRYVNGWWNPSDKDVLQSTDGYNFIYNDGSAYYYTGLTSSGADESTVGFVLINTRTKETNFYKVSGSHENAAMDSAEGKVQNLGYEAAFPILINVDGTPTYFMSLKDKKGLIKLYAMVNVNDYSIVGTGESLSKTKSNYIKYLKDRGNWQGINNTSEEAMETGTVLRIGSSVIEDTTYYYIVLKENPNKIFITSMSMSNELPLTRDGDKVQISYYKNPNSSIDLVKFDNLQFIQTKSQGEEAIIEQNVKIENDEKSSHK